jgi:hypothetical protein
MRKQTAVDWLFGQISNSLYYYKLIEDIESKSTMFNSKGIFQQAKEMEEEQLLEYWKGGMASQDEGGVCFDQYHNGTELKTGDWVKLEGYDVAWIGWVTNSSYLICKIKSRVDENGKTSDGWMMMNTEVYWVLKSDWHSKN